MLERVRHAAARVRARGSPLRAPNGWSWRTRFLERPDEPAVVEYTASQAAELESELLEVARGVVESRFEPTGEPHRELCADCPGRAALCSWGPERTLAEAV